MPSVIREASGRVVNMLSPAGLAGSRKSGLGGVGGIGPKGMNFCKASK